MYLNFKNVLLSDQRHVTQINTRTVLPMTSEPKATSLLCHGSIQKNLVVLLWIFTISLHELPRLADLRQTGVSLACALGLCCFVFLCIKAWTGWSWRPQPRAQSGVRASNSWCMAGVLTSPSLFGVSVLLTCSFSLVCSSKLLPSSAGNAPFFLFS